MALTAPSAVLTGSTIASSFDQLLFVDAAAGMTEATLKIVSTEVGKSALQISDEHVLIKGVDTNNAAGFEVQQTDGTSILKVAAGTPAATLVGDLTVTGNAIVTTADNTDTLRLVSTDSDANVGPNLILHRDGGNGADNDLIGLVSWAGEDDAGNETDYFFIRTQIEDASNTTEDAKVIMVSQTAGSGSERISLLGAETVINEDSNDIDFRVESNGNANMLFVDGGNDRVGIGTASPSSLLTVQGATNSAKIDIDSTGAGNGFLRFLDDGAMVSQVQYYSDALYTDADAHYLRDKDGTSRMSIVSGNVGIGDTDPSEAKLSIAGVASGDIGINLVQDQAQAGLFIDHNANHNAISIDSENTTQYGIYVEADALTTGSAGYFYSDSSDTSTRNVVKITNDHASATGAVALTVRQDAAVQGVVIDQNGNNQALKIDTEATTAHAIDIDAPATTTGKVINIGDANALTTGAIASFHSDSSNNDSRNLVYIANHHASADNAVGLYIHQDGADASIELAGNGSIKFPGTQGASSDANSLDDYEEGTFTPTYVSSGASFSYTSQFGGYTKIGRMVYFDAYIVSNSASGGTAGNAVYIGGLPFTCASSKYSFGGNVTQTTQWGGDFPTHALVVEGDTTLHLHYRDASDSEGLAIRYDDMATGTSDNYVGIYGFYQI